jgi:hypothetical protein
MGKIYGGSAKRNGKKEPEGEVKLVRKPKSEV